MPLPTNGSYPVLGYSRPGEAVQSKPKQAMIVRMSPETLDALQDFPNNPPIDFQFGDTPGIFIGETFFPLVPSAENTPHDLYLRASTGNKKFSVQRELAPSVGEKVRESTTEAMNQRASRKAIMIDDSKALLLPQTKQRKKKEASSTTTSSSHSRAAASSSLLDKAKNKALASASRTSKNPVSANPLDKLSPERVQDIKRRLIHFLAPQERLEDEVVRAVGRSQLYAPDLAKWCAMYWTMSAKLLENQFKAIPPKVALLDRGSALRMGQVVRSCPDTSMSGCKDEPQIPLGSPRAIPSGTTSPSDEQTTPISLPPAPLPPQLGAAAPLNRNVDS
ncbi:hypothetical protein DFP72DRAFT_1083024 [Ephemerocybe angulata]|uniref:Uncharacterized protein n=1 Tax=Ephemerocybe angulata TaxID=980116 RepID=A0A8H6LV28_9AGAR|nr:hypothetical protein DFP72DRAFT_1083024 [Tulosesus angulatus]